VGEQSQIEKIAAADMAVGASMGVKCAAIPRPGYRSPAWLAREHTRPFGVRAWRAGGEARISRLKHTFGMHRTRYRGPNGVSRCAFWAGIANNLLAIGGHAD
jgi:hypothetical protein